MIYPSKEGDLDLSKITRLYPAVVVEMEGQRAEMSLEWCEMYAGRVNIVNYVLVFDFTLPSDDEKTKTILEFETKEALLEEMNEVAKFLA